MMTNLLSFLEQLEEQNIHYMPGHCREAINVHVSVPTGRWEVEFFEDGHVEVEIFVPDGKGIGGAERLTELFLPGAG